MKSKIYNEFYDKYGNRYAFATYSEFALFWFKITYKTQLEYFPQNREKLQRAADRKV